MRLHDGAFLDPDDRISDLVDDREEVISNDSIFLISIRSIQRYSSCSPLSIHITTVIEIHQPASLVQINPNMNDLKYLAMR